ncbi:MAG: heavy-metal-associated domain-containing protein [Candidatus Rokubacteria bacterium]|nr:heavy-metal-associated domain-containing protein [Candidatus Rokubacteria bacterium]
MVAAVVLALLLTAVGPAAAEVRDHTLTLDGPLCYGCVPRIHAALEGRPGVHRVKVDIERGAVSVSYDDDVTLPERLAEYLKAAGFPTNGRDPCRGWRRWVGRC